MKKKIAKICKIAAVIVLTAELILTVIFWEYRNISIAAVMPIMLMLSPLSTVFGEIRRNYRRIKYDGDLNDFMETDRHVDDHSETLRLAVNIMLCIAPILFPFVFFFGDKEKTLIPLAIFFVFVLVGVIYCMAMLSKEHKKKKKADEAELRRQREREESGRFK